MNAKQYLDRLLVRYSGTFNIYKPYSIAGKTIDAYGYFYNHLEKYVLVRDANLWSSDSFEHVFYITGEQFTLDTIRQYEEMLKEHAEPELVRKGEKLPSKNHMYSYLTLIFISDRIPEKEIVREVKRFRFEKGYMMNTRGYSQAHVCLVSVEDGKIYTNYVARKSKKILSEVYKEVQQNKIGFDEMCEKHNIEPFVQ